MVVCRLCDGKFVVASSTAKEVGEVGVEFLCAVSFFRVVSWCFRDGKSRLVTMWLSLLRIE